MRQARARFPASPRHIPRPVDDDAARDIRVPFTIVRTRNGCRMNDHIRPDPAHLFDNPGFLADIQRHRIAIRNSRTVAIIARPDLVIDL